MSNVQDLDTDYKPAGQLVPVFSASTGLQNEDLTLSLAKTAAKCGQTVLMLDACGGVLMKTAGLIYHKTLADVLYSDGQIEDVKYVTSNEHFTAMACGDAPLGDIVGSLAAFSLNYDWVFVSLPSGCTPAHVRLAAAADVSILNYDSTGDLFMRAYWMMDAIRARTPKFDPLLLSTGPREDAAQTALMLNQTLREFLGAPPPYAGHSSDPDLTNRLLAKMREITKARIAA